MPDQPALRIASGQPTAKMRSVRAGLAVVVLLPVLNYLAARLGLPALSADDIGIAAELAVALYTAVGGFVVWVRAYLRRPEDGDAPVRDWQ